MTTNFILTSKNVTITKNKKTVTLATTHENFAEVKHLIFEDQVDKAFDRIIEVSSLIKNVSKRIGRKVAVSHSGMCLNDETMPKSISDKIIEYTKQKLPYDAILNFWERLKKNPSEESKKDLYGFLQANRIALTEDGHFVTYKRVKHDFKDVHSGTLDNTPGNIVEMPRERVDSDRNQTCSSGLHVAGWSYLSSFSGDKVVECKVDPVDVVSVPTDYGNSKMRVCRYKVLREIPDMMNNPSAEEILYDPIYRDKNVVTKEEIQKEKPVKESKNLFKQKITAEKRLPISGEMTKGIGVKPGNHIGVDIVKGTIVLTKNYKAAEWNYRTNDDGRMKISKSILEKIGNLVTNYRIQSSKDKIIVSKGK